MSTPTVDRCIVSSRFLLALIATGASALKVVRNLVALKATVDRKHLVALKAVVDRNVNSHCWQDW